MHLDELVDTLVVDLANQVVLVEFLHGATHVLLVHLDALYAVVLVDRRLEEVALFDQGEGVNVIQQLFKEAIEVFLFFGQQSFVEDTLAIADLHTYQVIQVGAGLQLVIVDLPGGLEDFNHNVIMNIVDEVRHLLMCKVESMEAVLHPWELSKFV